MPRWIQGRPLFAKDAATAAQLIEGLVQGVAPGAALGDFFGAFYHALYVVGADAVAALGAAVLVQPRCGHFRCHMRIDGEILVLKAGEDDLLPDE